MEGGGRARWLAALLVSAAIMVVSFNGEAAMADGVQQPATATAGAGPDTSVLCVSKCGTCPTVCSTPPPPTSSSYGGIAPPATATPGSGGGGGSSSPSHSTSPPGQQSKGGHPSNYYYFFTAGAGRCAGPSVYALVLLVSVSLAATFFP
ncbi:hypothetical protein EJB05_49990, partial [Eragrostis curvula]